MGLLMKGKRVVEGATPSVILRWGPPLKGSSTPFTWLIHGEKGGLLVTNEAGAQLDSDSFAPKLELYDYATD